MGENQVGLALARRPGMLSAEYLCIYIYSRLGVRRNAAMAPVLPWPPQSHLGTSPLGQGTKRLYRQGCQDMANWHRRPQAVHLASVHDPDSSAGIALRSSALRAEQSQDPSCSKATAAHCRTIPRPQSPQLWRGHSWLPQDGGPYRTGAGAILGWLADSISTTF